MEAVGDWILLGFVAVATVLFLFANIVIFRYRRRSYFVAHGGVELILLGSAAGLVWIASEFVTNHHFRRKGIFKNCVLWAFWLKISFGLCLWLVCIILRLNRMEQILNRQTEAPSFWRHSCLWILLLMLPNLIVSVAATLTDPLTTKSRLHHHHHHYHHRGHWTCKFKLAWTLARYLFIPPFYFVGVLVFLFPLRKQKDVLVRREYVHTSDYCAMAFIVYILTGVTYLTRGDKYVEGRCFLTFCVCCLVFLHFWERMAWPVYLCLFKPESEMDKYEDELRPAGAMIFNSFRMSGQINLPSSEEAVLRALQEASESLAAIKHKITGLEMEKSRLENENRLLKPSREFEIYKE